MEVLIISKELKTNEEIRAKEVRMVDDNGEQLGIMVTRDALKLAQERELDLVEISPNGKPPVCKLMNYGKYRFEQSKREKEARKKQKVVSVKEVKFRLGIEEHDYQVKAKAAQKFLQDGDKLKVTIMFRGRERAHTEAGTVICMKLAKQLEELASIESRPSVEGRNMIMVLAPRSDKTAKKTEE